MAPKCNNWHNFGALNFEPDGAIRLEASSLEASQRRGDGHSTPQGGGGEHPTPQEGGGGIPFGTPPHRKASTP